MSKFIKSLCKIAVPVTLQSMLQSSFSIIDQIMIGQMGEINISAVGDMYPLYWTPSKEGISVKESRGKP